MTPGADPLITAPLLAALETLWNAIHRHHPDVPAAVIVLASGAGDDGLNLGHFAADRWRSASAGMLPEVLVGGEGLARGSEDVLATLLHEAAHGVATARGVRDTSRDGRYHNQRFKALAEELGLDVAREGDSGWAATTMPAATAARYASGLRRLRKALVIVRAHEQAAPADAAAHRRRRRDRPAATCACQPPRRIRVAPGVLAGATIRCEACGHPFRHPAEDPQDAAGPARLGFGVKALRSWSVSPGLSAPKTGCSRAD